MEILQEIFDEIKTDIFGGCLDKPQFLCSHDGETYGWWWCSNRHGADSIININPVYCNDYLTIFTTMAHEMCHNADYLFYRNSWKRLTHRGKFAKLASEIETFYQLPKGSI
mgnify:CR=1 FL=1